MLNSFIAIVQLIFTVGLIYTFFQLADRDAATIVEGFFLGAGVGTSLSVAIRAISNALDI